MNNIQDYFLKTRARIYANQMQNEGSTVSVNDTNKLITLKTQNTEITEDVGVKYNDLIMFSGLDKGWEYVFSNYDQDIDIRLIKIINTLVSDETNTLPGQLRTKNNIFVTLKDGERYYPELPKEEEINIKLNEINQIQNPIEKSFELFRYISRTQMFENCNKRTATLIANFPLVKNDIALFYPINNLYNEFTSMLTEYYVDPSDINIKKCDRFIKENFLTNQELDAKRKEQGYHMIYDHEVDKLLIKRAEHLNNIDNKLINNDNEEDYDM